MRIRKGQFAGVLIAMAGSVVLAVDRPNVLMIAVDDLRPMLGCYGDTRAITPNIDGLAEGGMLFERAYCQYSKCGPSRLSLMTGLKPTTVGVFGHGDRDVARFRSGDRNVVTMAEWLKNHGYETRSFGKIDHDGWSQLRDWSEPPSPGREGEMLEIVDEADPSAPSKIAERWECPVMQSPDVPDDHLFAGRMTNEVIAEFEKREDERPFFYAVGFRRPHLPFVAPKRYFDMHEPDGSWLPRNPEPPAGVPPVSWFSSDGYVGGAKKVGILIPVRPNRQQAILLNGYEMRSYEGVRNLGVLEKTDQLKLQQAYAACVSYVDAQIGRLLETLNESGKRENTIVLLWSDHGWHLGEQSVWGKMTNYETGTRIPLIIDAPGKPAGRSASFAGLIDLYPTLCDLTGLEKPSHLEGSSLAPVLDDPDATVRDSVHSYYVRYNGKFTGDSVRTDRYRYQLWKSREGEIESEELYDLIADPLEQKNLVKRDSETTKAHRILAESAD